MGSEHFVKTITVYFSDAEYKAIAAQAESEGLTTHKIVQNAIDMYINAYLKYDDSNDRLSVGEKPLVVSITRNLEKKLSALAKSLGMSVSDMGRKYLDILVHYPVSK